LKARRKISASLRMVSKNLKRNILDYIKYISKRNLLYPVVILAFLGVLIIIVPFKAVLAPPAVFTIDDIVLAHEKGIGYVSLDMDELFYTGYDFIVDDRAAASYYYRLDDDSEKAVCMFFLIPRSYRQAAGSANAESFDMDINYEDAENEASAPSVTQALNFTGKARLITKNKQFASFLDAYSEDIGWSPEALREAGAGLLVSNYNYHNTIYIVLAVLIALALIWCFVYIIINLITWIYPVRHEACKRLFRFGLNRDDFAAIDEELAKECIINAGNLFATSHYLVAFGKHSIYTIPLFNIIWAYKYSSWSRIYRSGKLRYTLVVVTSPHDIVRVPDCRKRDADKILDFLKEDFSHITVGYTDEIKAQMDKLRKTNGDRL
jgi:hypothetical protein